jgi:hypothetical protein
MFFYKNSFTQEEFFNKAVKTSYYRSYNGIVKRKYYLKEGGRHTIIIGKDGFKIHFDYVYEKQSLYEFIKVGDTLIKRSGSHSIVIKRSGFDTVIYLKLEKIKGVGLYFENNKFLNN